MNSRRIISLAVAFLSCSAFVSSLFFPAVWVDPLFSTDSRAAIYGWVLLLSGWFDSPVAWFANLAYLCGLTLLIRGCHRLGLMVSITALSLALTGTVVVREHIIELDQGYFLWIGSQGTLALGSLLGMLLEAIPRGIIAAHPSAAASAYQPHRSE